jgi:hypothetical protein
MSFSMGAGCCSAELSKCCSIYGFRSLRLFVRRCWIAAVETLVCYLLSRTWVFLNLQLISLEHSGSLWEDCRDWRSCKPRTGSGETIRPARPARLGSWAAITGSVVAEKRWGSSGEERTWRIGQVSKS